MYRTVCAWAMLCVLLAFGSAGASDYSLEIFGNANMDETIDERDITYVEGIIKGTNAATNLSDANYDGKVDEKDITQIEQTISGEEKEITIICNPPNGKIVTIKKPVERIAVLTPDSAEALVALDSEDKVVGVPNGLTPMELTFPLLSKLQAVAAGHEPDCEAIINLNPDVIITYGSSPDPSKLDDNLEGTNITVIRLDCWKPEYITGDIKKLGYMLGKETNADELIAFQTKYLEIIKDRLEEIPEDERPRVYLEGYGDYSTWSKGWGIHWLCALAGGTNIAADLPGSNPEIDSEWVLEQNPDIIVKVTSASVAGYEITDHSQIKEIWEAMISRPGWDSTIAVNNEKVYAMSRDMCYGTDYVIGLIYLAKWFHPDLFEDLDPQAIHQEYLTRFQHLDYDLDKHGVFVYPPLEE
mgnify:CR=1 FL=1